MVKSWCLRRKERWLWQWREAERRGYGKRKATMKMTLPARKAGEWSC